MISVSDSRKNQATRIKIKSSLAESARTCEKPESNTIKIPNLKKDRLGTLAFISWWDKERVSNARVLVVGAGALGNEVLKNLALMGIGSVYIVDMDTVEAANLSRSILFRQEDAEANRRKVDAAAERVREINPNIYVSPIQANITYEIGLGLFRRMDVVIGCLDNREARARIDEACYQTNVPWVEGAITHMDGKVQVFSPQHQDTPCYNCTLTEKARQMMYLRRSCKLYAARDIAAGKVPTTSITASIVGAMQTQETLKIINGMHYEPGVEYRFSGALNSMLSIRHQRKPDCDNCGNQSALPEIIELQEATTDATTPRELLNVLQDYTGEPVTLLPGFDLVIEGTCNHCGYSHSIMKPLESLTAEDLSCAVCGSNGTIEIDEFEQITNRIRGAEPFVDQPLSTLGVPRLAILQAVTADGSRYAVELTGDARYYHLPMRQ